jgi:hypothetical protein
VTRNFSLQGNRRGIAVLVFLLAIAGIVVWSGSSGVNLTRRMAAQPRLVSIQPLPEMDGAMCEYMPASATPSLVLALQEAREARDPVPSDSVRQAASKRLPVRTMRDQYSAYSAVAVDPTNNEVVMTDENLFSILSYNRTDNTPPSARMSEPKRIIRGEATDIEFQCSLYVDPSTGDIYAANNDTLGKLVIFSRQAKGDVAPDRSINTPHTTYGIAVHEATQELMLTIQDDAAVVTYPKSAKDDEPPIRLLQGEKTLLADPHGIALDKNKNLLYVSNWGSVNVHTAPPGGAKTGTLGRGNGHPNWPIGRNYSVPGSGTVNPVSITVYPRDARGDVAPLRVIRGPKTQLSWPTALAVNPATGELFVANDTGHAVLVFGPDGNGDVAPIRVIKGPKSLIQNPTGVFFDEKNNELWVANFGNHSATVYRPDASGDSPPIRVIRSGPLEAPAPMLGNPHVVTYDSRREEILVAN